MICEICDTGKDFSLPMLLNRIKIDKESGRHVAQVG